MSDAPDPADVTHAQARALDLAASGAPLERVFEELVRGIEAAAEPGVLGSILLLDEAGERLRHGAAPSLPPAYCEAIDGIEIGPTAGSCGRAAYSGPIIMVRDVATDPLWRDFKHLALAHGLRACWSTPILSASQAVLGTFALYHGEPRSPTIEERTLVARLCETAAEILERAGAKGSPPKGAS